MRIVLINPPSPFLIRSDTHGPLGLWYLGAALKAAGHTVTYADLCLGDEIPDDGDVYGVTGTTPQLGAMLRIIADLYAAGKHVIAGGPHATVDPQPLLDAGAQVVVQGEGEHAIFTALAMIANSNDPNLCYCGGLVQATRIRDLDKLAPPDRSQARRYRYFIKDRHGNPVETCTIMSSRGCPHKCAFCAHSLWKQTYRCRSAENVLAEVANLHHKHGYDGLMFFDDTLAVNRKRLFEICEGLEQLPVVWRCFVRADAVDPDLLQRMAQAGCVELGIGVESGSDLVLAAIDKGETVAQQEQAIKWARQAGIRTKTFLIVGLPGEDWSTVQETIDFVDRARPDDIDVSILSILPGSPIHADPARFGIELTGGPSFYKGKPGQYTCSHRTAALSSDDLIVARNYVEARCKPK